MSDFIEVEHLPSSQNLSSDDYVLINQNDDDAKLPLGELKEYCRPELATTTESGLVSTGEQSFSGKKTFTEVSTNKATVSNATIQNGNITEATVKNLRITGDLIQDGETVETEVETLKVQNQVIVTRSGATVGMGDGEYTGIKAEKYDGVNDGVLAFGPDGVARVGDEGSTQPLATREEAPTNNSIQVWDEQTQSLKSFPFGQKGQYLRQGENGLEYGSAVAVDETASEEYVNQKVQEEATFRQNAIETLDNKVDSKIINKSITTTLKFQDYHANIHPSDFGLERFDTRAILTFATPSNWKQNIIIQDMTETSITLRSWVLKSTNEGDVVLPAESSFVVKINYLAIRN